MTAYYNEIDPFAAQWLRNLIAAGHIAPGDVDERSILDVRPDDLHGYTQCHFFAGIGVWSYALRMAGHRDDRQVWTGSCPCQPFSQAGQGAGFDDERHLWPHFHWLISQCRPAKVFGEQVASKDGLAWIDLVQADLEASDYAFGKADLCAAGFGAPHIRQRLYWMADSTDPGLQRRRSGEAGDGAGASWLESERLCAPGGLADDETGGRREFGRPLESGDVRHTYSRGDASGKLADANGGNGAPGPTNGFWRAADWLLCRDGKWRPVEPGTFPLVNGASGRVGRLRAYGNAIVAEQAIGFIEACTNTIDESVEN